MLPVLALSVLAGASFLVVFSVLVDLLFGLVVVYIAVASPLPFLGLAIIWSYLDLINISFVEVKNYM